ncbi:MAG TPA: hypothetical protein DCX46_13745, partial [Bacteroidetes bacterium]|nr:hypothetical protein [Bacteroidota bacterium]
MDHQHLDNLLDLHRQPRPSTIMRHLFTSESVSEGHPDKV